MLNFNIDMCVIEAVIQVVEIVLEGHGLYIPKYMKDNQYRIASYIETSDGEINNIKMAADIILEYAEHSRPRQPVGKVESYCIAVEITRIYKLMTKGE